MKLLRAENGGIFQLYDSLATQGAGTLGLKFAP